MTRQERMALALAYQQRNRPNLDDLAPEQMTAMQAPTQQPTMSLLDRISETGAGIGKGLANTVEGMGQMVTAPIETGKEMYRNVSDVVRNPSLIVEALKQMGQKATSSPAGFGEVVGENINPRNFAKTLAHPKTFGISVYHATNADPFEKFDLRKNKTAKHIYTSENPDEAMMYGKNLLSFEASPKNLLDTTSDSKDVVKNLKIAAKNAGITDKYYSFEDFMNDFSNGDIYQKSGGQSAMNSLLDELFSKYDAVRIPDAVVGGGIGSSVVFRDPNILKRKK